jgi:hypothetical protein
MKLILAFILSLATRSVFAVPIESIESKQTSPLAPRGGVLMVQLITESNGKHWPFEIDVVFEGGVHRTGVVGWIEANPNTSLWTSNPFTVRPVTHNDDSLLINPTDTSTGPVLLVELPEEGYGTIKFGGMTLLPKWINLPPSLPNLNLSSYRKKTELRAESPYNLPEWNPLEYWRWTLLASRLDAVTPEPPNLNEVERLVALRESQLWRIGFNRLARSSRGVAAACRDLLSNTAYDAEYLYACWVVNPDSLRRLLSIMLDMTTTSRQLATRALRWVEDQRPYVQWLEQVYGENITIAIANPTLEPVVASIKWQDEGDIPIAVEVAASHTFRAHATRPPLVDLSIFGPVTVESQLQWLALLIGKQSYSLPIVPPSISITPPSIQFQVLHPLWNLQSIQLGKPTVVDKDNATTVQLRKILGVWELFISCKGNSNNCNLPETITTIEQLRGIETVSILHPDTNTIATISPAQERVPNGMTVSKVIKENNWSVRIELPNTWTEQDSLSFAVARTHGDSKKVETGPLPCVPWKIHPTPIVVDLSEWNNIDRFPDY